MLPFPDAVELLLRGESGLLDGLAPGLLVIDGSSTPVDLTREFYRPGSG